MTAWFNLTLDTHAPVVTWGAVGGATAGETLDVRYTSDEPLATAVLDLPDGRHLAMSIAADRLTVLLPPDTPDGISWIRVADDVGNESPRQAINISGTIVVPPPEPPATVGGGFGGRPRPSAHPERVVETRTIRTRSRGQARSRVRTSHERASERSISILDSRSSIHSSRTMNTAGELRSSARTSVRQFRDSGISGSRSTVVVERREGPGNEDLLAVLGVL